MPKINKCKSGISSDNKLDKNTVYLPVIASINRKTDYAEMYTSMNRLTMQKSLWGIDSDSWYTHLSSQYHSFCQIIL